MMDRRDVFGILSATAVAPVAAAPVDWSKKPPRFFTSEEYAALGRLVDRILPADKEGGGALAAGVPYFIDTTVLYADEAAKTAWRAGLAKVRPEELEQLATREGAPSTPAGHFFVRLKSITILGWAASDEGARYLGYKGNKAHAEFPGCTHPEHQR